VVARFASSPSTGYDQRSGRAQRTSDDASEGGPVKLSAATIPRHRPPGVIGGLLGRCAAYVGDVITVAFDFCPAGWLPFNGQLLPIGEHETLFQLIGTTYGGDRQETFALPLGHAVMTADRKALMQCIATYGVFPSPS